jgi:hypothetical protein
MRRHGVKNDLSWSNTPREVGYKSPACVPVGSLPITNPHPLYPQRHNSSRPSHHINSRMVSPNGASEDEQLKFLITCVFASGKVAVPRSLRIVQYGDLGSRSDRCRSTGARSRLKLGPETVVFACLQHAFLPPTAMPKPSWPLTGIKWPTSSPPLTAPRKCTYFHRLRLL